MLKGKMEFRLGTEQRVCGPGDVVVIPGGSEQEAWFREDTEVIDFFAPPRKES
jgi:quercetin dioxygenase-like cupin family protein